MSLARLSLPSFGSVLEADPSIPRKRSAPAMRTQALEAPTSSLMSSGPAPAPQPHLMKTIDFRDNDLESEEEELFSPRVGFPVETMQSQAEVQATLGDQAASDTAQLQGRKPSKALSLWLKVFRKFSIIRQTSLQANYPRMAAATRKLLPVKIAEALLFGAGQKEVHH